LGCEKVQEQADLSGHAGQLRGGGPHSWTERGRVCAEGFYKFYLLVCYFSILLFSLNT